jgi:hypothetical protein
VAGYREFQTGEVLTAANVNDFLMDQSVMKFADAAARDTALGTAVGGSNALREGMVAYLDSTDEVQFYDGSAWAAVGAEPPAGIGSNVVQAAKTDPFSTSSSSFEAVTGLSVTITPTAATSKILLLATLNLSMAGTTSVAAFRLSGGNASDFVGDADGNRARVLGGAPHRANKFELNRTSLNHAAAYLDSPATTSAVTYQIDIAAPVSGIAYLNRTQADTDNDQNVRSASSLIAIEVAA